MRALHILALTALLGVASSAGQGASFAPASAVTLSLDVVAFPCSLPDGICLGYGGVSPGPTLDLTVGDTLVVTLNNRIGETIGALPGSAELKARLAASAISLHTHGMPTSVASDGIPSHPGTRIPDSTAPAGASYTYFLQASFPGVWHYHDHVLGADGAEGVERGLFGTIIVRNGAEPAPDRVIDAHILERGVNGVAGLSTTVPAGSSFDLAATAMGNFVWSVTVKEPAPSGFTRTFPLGPGVSERVHVASALPGTYVISAKFATKTVTGQVVVS